MRLLYSGGRRLLLEAARGFAGGTAFVRRRLLHASLRRIGADHALDIPSWTQEDELHALHDLAASCGPGASVLEIGSYLGASTCVLAAGLGRNGGHLFCVDTWQNETMPEGERDTFATFERNCSPFRDMITPLRMRSDQLSADDLEIPLDLVFIDGDHQYAAIAGDWRLVQPWVARNGIVAFHDVGAADHPGVGRVVGEAIAGGAWTVGGIVRSLVWLVRCDGDRNPAADLDDTGVARATRPQRRFPGQP
jgi:predicted O-methyltransferase YrrM